MKTNPLKKLGLALLARPTVQKILNQPTVARLLSSTFIRFGIVGAVNTLVGTSIMFALYNLAGAGYWFSSACNYIISSIVSFYLNRRFTFRSHGSIRKLAVRFAVNIAACYFLAYGLAQPLVERLMQNSALSQTAHDNIAMVAGMVLFVCFNYLGQRFFTFREPQPPKKAEEESLKEDT